MIISNNSKLANLNDQGIVIIRANRQHPIQQLRGILAVRGTSTKVSSLSTSRESPTTKKMRVQELGARPDPTTGTDMIPSSHQPNEGVLGVVRRRRDR